MNATLFSLALALSPAADPYPNPDILIDADKLKAVDAKTLTILDARDAKAYAAGHVPGAVPLNLTEFAKTIPDTPESWAAKLGKLGIKADTPVVVYGAADVRDAARAWWLLKYAGADKVRLLNGGYPAWEKAGGTVEATANEPRPVEFGKPVKTNRLAEKETLLSILKDRSAQILDARSNDEYCGVAGKAKRMGHIPGAVQLEWSELLAADKKFKSPDELKKLMADRKIDLGQPAVTYCQGGGRAAVLAFGLELMGAKDVRNYYKSWGDWGNAADTPVELPKK